MLFLNLLLNFPLVQSALAHSVTNYYARKFHVKIRIGKVDFEFLKKLVLRDVYIQDQHADTLLYAQDLKFDIGQLSFKNHQLYLSNIDIDKATIHLTTYKKEHALNLQFLIDAFASPDTTKSSGPKWDVGFGELTLNDVDFRLLNQHDTSTDNYGLNTANLRLHHLNANINTIRFMGDTARATIENLEVKEQSGFSISKMSCYVALSPHGMELDALKLLTPNSEISTDLIFKYSSFADFDDFTNKIYMRANFHRSKVCFADIQYFAHGMRAVNNCFMLSGEYEGTVNHLNGKNMSIGWGEFSNLEGNLHLDNITTIDSAFIHVNVTSLVTSKPEIETLPAPPFDRQGHLKLPDNMNKLGVVHFNGSFEGSIKAFMARGAASTAIGTVSADLNMKENAKTKEAEYTGTLATDNFNLGDFWQVNGLGAVTTSVSISGTGLKRENADATLSGVIQSLTFRNYTYQNTKVSGELKKGFFSGTVKVIDPHLLLDFDGKISLASQNSIFQFDARITKANLTALHIIKDTDAYAMLSGRIKVNATGNNLDNLDGVLTIDSTSYAIKRKVYYLNHLALNSTVQGDYRKINVSSDYVNGELSGHFRLSNTVECLQGMLSDYLPNQFKSEKHLKNNKDMHDYTLSLHFNQDTGLTGLFLPGWRIATGTQIDGRYDESSGGFSLTGNSKEIDISAKRIRNWKLNATGDGKNMVFRSRCDTLYLSDSLYAASFKLKGDVSGDTLQYTVGWNDDSANFGNIPGSVIFCGNSKLVFKFSHPVISMVDSVWKINNENNIVYDSLRWKVNSFIISHSSQSFISLGGRIGSRSNDKLDIGIHNVNLASLSLGNTSLQGELNGEVSLSSLFGHPFFTSALKFSGLRFNKGYLGDGDIDSRWDTSSRSILLDGHFAYHGEPVLSVTGKYIPGNSDNNLSLDASLSNFPSALFQPYIKVVCSSLDGGITGQAHITGTPGQPLIYGNVTERLKKMKFDYINTSYHSPGINIKIMPDTFQILPSVLLDEKDDTAYYSGIFTHQNFKNLQMDFRLKAKNFLCLNTNETQNSSYFGRGFVSGDMRIFGPIEALHIDANITTDKNTIFNIPLETASELDQADYIQFTNKNKNAHAVPAYKIDLGGLSMDFTVHVNDAATCNLLFSYKGEVLQSKGYGTIQFSMNNIGVINMRGNYTVNSGYYVFVMSSNIINKKFLLKPGGTITWNGDPYNADIDLTTYYATSASLEPFFQGNDPSGVYNKRFPVNCDLDLSGKLTSPDISFKIELPTVDNQTRQIIDSYLSNGDELKTQVFTLLIINSFVSPAGAGIANTSGSQFGVATSAEMLSNQFSNWFNKINNSVNVSVDYQPGSAINPTEAKLALTKEFLNGRVVVNTDVGTTSGVPTSTTSSTTNTNFVGEVNAEYIVSKNGKLRVKAFNKANDNTTDLNTLNAPYTQGAGISYKEGFTTWKEFFHKLFSKKQEETTPADSSGN